MAYVDSKTLRREMGAREWHMGQVGDASGIHRTTVGRAIAGESVQTETLDAIAGALGLRALVAFLPAEPYAGQQIKIELPELTVTLTLHPKAPAVEAQLAAVA